ncbi:IBR finger domain-containing protein [Daldinia bambusicola]|nr:IBR finger domain-containing protein [Daldinia bambusicola]
MTSSDNPPAGRDNIRQSDPLDNSGNAQGNTQGNAAGELSDAQLAIRLCGEELNNAATIASNGRITLIMGEGEVVYRDGVPDPESEGSNNGVVELRECLACGETTEVTRLVKAPCGHEYCLRCLAQLFRNATTDETLYPPRCCRQEIPLRPNERFLPNDIVTTFREKAVEFSTTNRTYCHRPTCSVFIHPNTYVNNVATCHACQSRTCVTCKRQSHDGDCPYDEDLQQVMRLAREQGWQRCANCRAMVELNTGCNHITCRCGAQFCYLCGRPWKSCPCVQWDEERLYNRAAAIYNRDRDLNLPDPDFMLDHYLQFERLRNIADDLRDNHECLAHIWHSTRGRYYCDICGERMRYFVYECQVCNLLVCRNCRYNRM